MSQEERKIVRPSDVTGELVARRHNELIVTKHRLSMQAQRLFLYVVSMIDDTHDERTEYEFSVSDLAGVIGIDRSRLYKSMVEVMEEVAGSMVELPALDSAGKAIPNTIIRVGLIKNRQRVRYTSGGDMRLDGLIAVSLYKELLPYVRELKARFTEVELKYAFRLPSAYSLRIYDLIKAHTFRGQPWRVDREELRTLLNIGKDEYTLWGDFRRYVLEKAQQDIAMHTDIAFEIEYLKSGNMVTELVFHLNKEGGSEVEVLPGTDKHRAFKSMLELGLDAKAAENVLKVWWDQDPDLIRWHLSEVKRQKAIGKVAKPAGWFLAGLKKDFRPQRKLFQDMKDKAEAVRAAYNARVDGEPEEVLKKSLDELYAKFDVDNIEP